MKDKSMPYYPWADCIDPDSTKQASLAFKSLEKGVATPDQQKYVLEFLVKIGCRTYDTDWFHGDHSASDFAAGRRFVGQQIVEFINLKVGRIKDV